MENHFHVALDSALGQEMCFFLGAVFYNKHMK
jgi:hypothetical protein